MFNKNYEGRKDIRICEVFDSSAKFPKNWFECLQCAKAEGFRYIDFNGNIYSVDSYKNNESVDFQKIICEREDLIETVTIKIQISKKDYDLLKKDPSVELTRDNIVKGELADDNYGNTILILETLKTN